MEENTELEEGEACYYNDDEDNIDIDSLSYFDERIQNVLGHFQKDFEGGVSAESLGPIFGGYGSFLPTYERSPCFKSHPKTPQRNHNSPNSTINLHSEVVSDNTKEPSNVPPFARLKNAYNSSHPSRDLKAASVNYPVKENRGVSSIDRAERGTLKDATAKQTGNSTQQRTLRFRIKVKSNVVPLTNAEIYNGLGLGDSPSSSMGNSPEESEDTRPVSQENAEDSPRGIIQAMTSFPIPGGVFVSPLHECLLNLTKNRKIIGDGRYLFSLNGNQDPCSMSTDESDSFMRDGHLKKRRGRFMSQSENQLELTHMNGNLSENDMILNTKKRLGNKTPDHKDFLSNELKWTPLSSSICDAGETAEVTVKASEASKDGNENGVQGRMVSVEALKEESLESISGQDFEKTGKKNAGNGFMKNVVEHKLENSHSDNFTDPKSYMISCKVERDAVKYKINKKSETHQKVKAVPEQKNKLKGDQNTGKAKAVAIKDSFAGADNAMVTDKVSAGFDVTCRNKMNKLKLLKDNKFSDSSKDSLKGKTLEQKVGSLAGNGAMKNVNVSNEKKIAFRAKVKDRSSGNKVVKQSLAGPCINVDSGSLPIPENNPAPEMIPPSAPVYQVIEEWVCCDICEQWRLLPLGTKPEHLPERWLCSMLNWLPGMNSCDFSEDETTKALRALHQMPVSEGQNNMQSLNTGTATGVSSTHALQNGLNHKKSSSDVLPDQGKKKNVIKGKKMPGNNNDTLQFSNSAKINNTQLSERNRSLNDMNQQPTDLKLMNKMSSSKGKHVPKEKEKQLYEGDIKHVKLKRKMDADQYRLGPPKKLKTENVGYAVKQLKPGTELEKVAPNSRNSFQIKATGKDMRKYDEYCLPEDVQDRLPVAIKRERDQAWVSSGGEPLEVKNNCKNDGLMKKRKLSDWLEDEKPNNSYSLHGDKLCDEEGNAGECRKEKFRILKIETKSATECGVRQVSLSGSRDQMAAGTEVRCGNKGHHLKKHKRLFTSHQASDSIDQLGKDLVSGQLLLAATSSSSKISGSHKAKTNFEEVRGSPVESVTSSPLRATILDKNFWAVGDISAKANATKCGVSSVGSRRSVDNREGKPGKLKEDRHPYNLHPATDKLSSIEWQVGDVKDTARVQAKICPELKNNHLLEDGVPAEQRGNCANGVHHEEKVNKDNQDRELSWHNSGKVTTLHSKGKDRRSNSHVGTDKMKVSVSEIGYSKNSGKYDSVVDPSYHASGAETRNDATYSSPKSKTKTDSVSHKGALRHRSNEAGKQTELTQRDFENSVSKIDTQCSTDRKTIYQQNLTQDFKEANKANHVSTESRDGKSKALSSAAGEARRETLNVSSRTVSQYQKGEMSNELPVRVSGNGDLAKLKRNCADVSNNVGVNHSSGNFAPDQSLTLSSPLRMNSNQTAVEILEEATKLKDRADHFKNSGFDFESNETFFQAGLKFLHGASLLENGHNESSQQGELSQMQMYATAAKLFKSCALEYESRQELAAAALAYKCMEVAYMRVVYCKHSITNRDWHELQSTLQMVSQGESPSSSASDVDNLNNQAAADKVTLPRGTNAHVAVNQVISARTRPNLIRLIDFTQDTLFAMEAFRKCQSTFMAIMEEAEKKDCIIPIRSVMDFSFQDVDVLVHLVWTATRAISRAGLGGARD
ncbi:hypothetical protein RJT34_14730 [Clitoria ternatea]|uniref:CW-type domain-containing protein n=1 Tax=Clitoria ternatea TaxID=43366 RepID=A0AAN9PN76_CLITE